MSWRAGLAQATSFLQESATVTSCALGKLEEAAVCASEHLVVMREVAESLAETIEVVADDGLVLHDRVKALCSKVRALESFVLRSEMPSRGNLCLLFLPLP